MKPLELVERALEDASRPGDLVLDPFVGSGTTIIAAEPTGRRCAAIELDPIHAGVAIARWEAFTGSAAERIDGRHHRSQADVIIERHLEPTDAPAWDATDADVARHVDGLELRSSPA